MISAGDFKNGITLEIDGNVCQIVEFQHVKPGKGAAFVRTKIQKTLLQEQFLRNLSVQQRNSPAARIERVDMQYLYDDGDLYYFYERRDIRSGWSYKRSGWRFSLNSLKRTRWLRSVPHNGNVFAIEPPLFVELEVTETEPGFAGNTAQGATKTGYCRNRCTGSGSAVC